MRKGWRRLIWAALGLGLVVALVKLGESREALEALVTEERLAVDGIYLRTM